VSSRFLAPRTDIDHEQDCGAFAYRFVAHCFADPFNLCENRIALRFGDVSDGLEAVHKTKELRPDLRRSLWERGATS
jgi:hypothetical protein